MLLIPIAQEQSIVRRTPWVSLAVIALNFVVFLSVLASADPDARRREADDAGRDAAKYLSTHPYLDVPPRIAEYANDDFLAKLQQAKAEYEEEDRLPEPEVLQHEQAQIESLADRFLEALESGPLQTFGFKPAAHRPVTLVTYLFLHDGWMHLLGNMLFFFLSGPFIEDVFGRALFAVLYLLSGVAAAAAFAFHFPASMVPLVGASGAIAGIMGAFLVRLGAKRIRFLFLPLVLPIVRIRLLLPAFVVLPLWFSQQLWYAQVADRGSGVAWWAHVGGFAFGVAAALTIKLSGVEERWIHGAIERTISIAQHPGVERALDARTRGELQAAEHEIGAVLQAEPANLDAWSEAYEIALARHDAAEAGRRGSRLLDLLVKANETELAQTLVYEAPQRGLRQLQPRFCLAAAAFLERHGDAREALEFYQRVIDQAPADPAAFRALFRQAEILGRGGDLRAARAAYERARAHVACPDVRMVDTALHALGARGR